MSACGPTQYQPLKGRLYGNLGTGKFADWTRAWHADSASGRTLALATADFDDSGHQSLALANDDIAGNLLKDDGHHLTDQGANAGTAYTASGGVYGGMGADWGDYDNDGRLDLAVSTYEHQTKPIFHNDDGHLFTDQAALLDASAATFDNVAFGLKWLDVDNDGWVDLIVVSGHVMDNVANTDKHARYRQPTILFHNEHGNRFKDISASSLVGSAGRLIVGRGIAIGDYDNDGKIDALIVDSEGKPVLLHNETPDAGHWLEIELTGTKCNRDGQGALITVEAGGLKQVRQCTTNGSYLSASSRRTHIGLGVADTIKQLTVRWPGGSVNTYQNVRTDCLILLREGATTPSPAR